MNGFKLPQDISQDLLLISDLIGVSSDVPPLSPRISIEVQPDDSVDSSDTEIASEDEIQADLIPVNHEGELQGLQTIPVSDSSSESESGSSVNDDDAKSISNHDLDEDDESGPTGVDFQTKNEINETDVIIPDISEVGPEEILEKVGEIMSVMVNLVIVRGEPSERANKGSEQALDSDTLLVFEDRKVMGYIYETFGPTSQPLYQVKFSNGYPLDPEKMRIARKVFHVPKRSHFVFLSQIKQMKGSDASNVHDEEPAEHELEFSDDEAEAAFKSILKRKRSNSRAQSVVLSRQPTPSPSQMRDQDLVDDVILKGNAYDEHGPYDLDFSTGPSRPPPAPYDDPYADEYPLTTSKLSTSSELTSDPSPSRNQHHTSAHGARQDRGDARGHSSGRGRVRGRVREHDRRGNGRHKWAASAHSPQQNSSTSETSWNGGPIARSPTGASYDLHIPRPLSPTSLAIAHATGQLPDGSIISMPHTHATPEAWGYQNPRFHQGAPFHFNPQGPSPFVQPHINPRFASAFGLHMNTNMRLMQPQRYDPYEESNMHSVSLQQTSNCADEWAVPTGAPDEKVVNKDGV